MRRNRFKLLGSCVLTASLCAFAGCEDDERADDPRVAEIESRANKSGDASEVIATSASGVTLRALSRSTDHHDASLRMQLPDDSVYTGDVPFRFAVENFELGRPTDTIRGDVLAESSGGQHIHVVIDDKPYLARSETSFTERLAPGHHQIVAFLSRSHHESVKTERAYAVRHVQVGADAGERPYAEDAPTLVYSRPKGTYEGHDADAVLVDFYVINAALTPGGYAVELRVADLSATLTDWRPYSLEHLPEGDWTVRARLVDADGELVPGPTNDVSRRITIHRDDSPS